MQRAAPSERIAGVRRALALALLIAAADRKSVV